MYKHNESYFEKIDSEEKAYWLGFLYADGCIVRYYKDKEKKIVRSMSLEITLAEKDRGHLEKFKNALNSNIVIRNRITKLNGKEYKSCRIVIYSTKICEDLINLGCTPKKTYTLTFPTFDIVPKEYMRHFVRGFFDGDGCICVTEMSGNPHIITCFTGMESMLQNILDYLISEQVIRKIPKLQYDKRGSKACDLYIHGTDDNKEFLDFLYKDSNVYLDRKYQQYKNFYLDYNEIENKRGVYYSKNNKAYIASIYIDGKRIRIGQYKNIDDAINARKEAEIKKMKLKTPA